jgi:uncharacterized protein involved in exopolysaccharide biosynthesis
MFLFIVATALDNSRRHQKKRADSLDRQLIASREYSSEMRYRSEHLRDQIASVSASASERFRIASQSMSRLEKQLHEARTAHGISRALLAMRDQEVAVLRAAKQIRDSRGRFTK